MLSKKPATELAHSKQKLVQGMVEFSLETPRTVAAAAAAAVQETAAAGTSNTMNTDRPELSALDEARAGQGGASPCASAVTRTAKNMEGQEVTGRKTTTGAAVVDTTRERNYNEEAKTKQIKSAEGQNRTQVAKGQQHDVKHEQSAAAADNEDEWEGVSWDTIDVDEVESLGTVSARLTCADSTSLGTAGSITLGTVEIASEDGEGQPQDVLICLKGIVGMRQVTTYLSSSRNGVYVCTRS